MSNAERQKRYRDSKRNAPTVTRVTESERNVTPSVTRNAQTVTRNAQTVTRNAQTVTPKPLTLDTDTAKLKGLPRAKDPDVLAIWDRRNASGQAAGYARPMTARTRPQVHE